MKITTALSFNNFYTQNANKKIPIKTAYKLTKIFSSLQNDTDFYTNSLRTLLQESAEIGEDGNFKISPQTQDFIIKLECQEEFYKKYSDLINLEIEFDENLKIGIEELDGIEMSPKEVLELEEFFK